MGGAGGPEGQAQRQASAHCPLDKPQLRTDGDSRARPSGRGAPQGATAVSPLPGRWDGVVVPASTGSLVRRAERWVGWEPPAPPPTPEGVSAHGPVHGPSVSAWISHDSGDPSFHKCRTLRTVATASTVLPGGTPPATPPHTLLLRLAGSWSQDSPGHCTWPLHVAAPCLAWEQLHAYFSVDVFFLHRSGQTQSRSSPASAGRAAPHGGRPRTLGSRGVLLGRPASLPPPGSALWPVSPAVPTRG